MGGLLVGLGGPISGWWALCYGLSVAAIVLPATAWIETIGDDRPGPLLGRWALCVAALVLASVGGSVLFYAHSRRPLHGLDQAAELLGALVLWPPLALELGLASTALCLALQARRGPTRWRAAWRPSLGIVVVCAAAVAALLRGTVLPLPLLTALAVALTLPLAQALWLLLVLGDAWSVRPLRDANAPAPPPGPALDRFFAAAGGGGAFEAVPILFGLAAALEQGLGAVGLGAGLGMWLLARVAFTLSSSAWARVLLTREPERALAYARLRGHGKPASDPRVEQARLDQSLALIHLGRHDEAIDLVRDVNPNNVRNRVLLHNAAVALLHVDRPAEALDLLAADPPRGATMQAMWTITRSAALLALGRAQEALDALQALGAVRARALASIAHNNRALALLMLDGDPEQALTEALSGGDRLPLLRGTQAACRVRLGRELEASGEVLEARAQDESSLSARAFASFWAAEALDQQGETERAATLRADAIGFGGPWGERAGASHGAAPNAGRADRTPEPSTASATEGEPDGTDPPSRP